MHVAVASPSPFPLEGGNALHSPSFASDTRESVVCAVVVQIANFTRQVGVSCFDFVTKRIQLCEFQDNEHFTAFESLLLQLRPAEAFLRMTGSGGALSTAASATVEAQHPMDSKKLRGLFESCDTPLIDPYSLTAPPSSMTGFLEAGTAASAALEQDVDRLLLPWDSAKNHLAELSQPLACGALLGLLCQWKVLQDEANFEQCSLNLYPVDMFMGLDKAAFSALSILPSPTESNKSHTNILGLLNRCRTALGTRRLARWVSQPLNDLDKISQRHDVVEFFLGGDGGLLQTVQIGHLRKTPDLDKIIAKFHRVSGLEEKRNGGSPSRKSSRHLSAELSSPSSLEDMAKLYDCVVECHGLLALLDSALSKLPADAVGSSGAAKPEAAGPSESKVKSSVTTLITSPLRTCLKHLEGFLKLVEHAVEVDDVEGGRKYMINPKLDAELQKIGVERSGVWDKIQKHRRDVEIELGLEGELRSGGGKRRSSVGARASISSSGGDVVQNVKIIELVGWSRVFRVTKNHQQNVQSKSKIYRQVKINKADYQFTTNKLISLVQSLDSVTESFERRQAALITKALSVAASYWPVVEQLAEVIAAVDILAAFAVVSSCGPLPYCRPVLDVDGDEIHLEASRHALVEMQVNLKSALPHRGGAPHAAAVGGAARFVANDVHMSRRDGSWVQIITGPNMGGKSTYIRQVALVALLCQIGCWVPCRRAKLPVFSHILCRIGSSDVQLRGLSTFFAEMVEAAAIVRTAKATTLVIIDELGRGTSTCEGFGLAWSIARHVAAEIGAFCLFATHFHEMAALADQVKGVSNRHVTISIDAVDTHDTNSVGGEEEARGDVKETFEKNPLQLTFLYDVREGYADKSFGVHVARMAGLPQQVIERAEAKSKELEAAEIATLGASAGAIKRETALEASG